MATVAVQVRMDENLKIDVERIFRSMGLNMTSAINLFCQQTLNQRKLPFEIVPSLSKIDLETMREVDDILAHPEAYKGYDNIDELMRDLDA